MREVAIVGTGMTRFGELWESSLRDLFAEAALAALEDAGADHRLDAIYVGNMSAGGFVKQEHLGPLMADQIGMSGVSGDARRVGLRLGGRRVRTRVLRGRLGRERSGAGLGVEKMTDGADVTDVLAMAADQENEAYHGITFPGLYAMIARAHMEPTARPRKSWPGGGQEPRPRSAEPEGAVPPQDHARAGAGLVDGRRAAAAAALLSRQRRRGRRAALSARPRRGEYTDKPVKILASAAHGHGSMALADREDPAFLDAVQLVGRAGLRMAGVGPGEDPGRRGPRLLLDRRDLLHRGAGPGRAGTRR